MTRRLLIYMAMALFIGAIIAANWQVETITPSLPTTLPTPSAPAGLTVRQTMAAAVATPRPSVALPSDGATRRTPLAIPSRTPAAPTRREALPPLVFARVGQIWRSDGAGDAPRQLTAFASGTYAEQPALSPDGQRIAFVALVSPPVDAASPMPTSVLYLMPRDGGAPELAWAPGAGQLWLPTWSRDGRVIYILHSLSLTFGGAGDSRDNLQIVALNLADGTTTLVQRGALDPTMAPDGTRLAFLRFADDGYTMDLMLLELATGRTTRVVEGRGFDGFYAPRFSPDGQQIIVAAIGGPETDPAGRPVRGDGAWHARIAAWLEPPRALAHGAPWDLWIVAADGSGLRRLTWLYEDLPMAAFSPDGDEIVFLAYGGFYRMRRDGSELRRIDEQGAHGGIDWLVPSIDRTPGQ